MSREVRHLLLVLVGGALVKIVVDGTALRYVRPAAAPLVLGAGVVAVALAVGGIVRDLRAPRDRHDAHGHGTRSAWLLLVPVLTILLVAPPALGTGAVTGLRARAVPASPASALGPLPPGEAPALDVVDFVSRAVSDPTGPLTTRDVVLTGVAVTGGTGGHDLARLVISCCAADASAVRVHLDDPVGRTQGGPAGGDAWFRVRGRYVAGTGTGPGGPVPTLHVVDAVPVPAPDPVYEY